MFQTDLLKRAQLLEKNDVDQAIALIYDTLDHAFTSNKFTEVDDWMEDIRAEEYSVDILLSVLTASLPAKKSLPSRGRFFEKVRQSLMTQDINNSMIKLLLMGLE